MTNSFILVHAISTLIWNLQKAYSSYTDGTLTLGHQAPFWKFLN